jgi:hypothetical protein
VPLAQRYGRRVPVAAAGGASGLFGTAQQLGGAMGVAVFGTVFFGYLSGHSFAASMVHTAPYAIGAFALCAVLALLLPRHRRVGGSADRVLTAENHGPFGRKSLPRTGRDGVQPRIGVPDGVMWTAGWPDVVPQERRAPSSISSSLTCPEK